MAQNLFNTVFIGAFLYVIMTRPRLGVLLTAVYLLFFPIQFYGFGFAFGDRQYYVSNMIVLVLAFAALFWAQYVAGHYKLISMDWYLPAFLLLTFVTTLLVTAEPIGINLVAFFFRRFLLWYLFYYVGRVYAESFGRGEEGIMLSGIFKFCSILGLLIGGLALFEYVTHINPVGQLTTLWVQLIGSDSFAGGTLDVDFFELQGFYRYTGLYLESTETPLILSLCILAYVVLKRPILFQDRKWNAWIITGGTVVVLLSTTRGVIVPLLFLMLWHGLSSRRSRRIIVTGLIVLGVVGTLSYERIINEFAQSAVVETRLSNEETGLSRMIALTQGLTMFLQKPLLGHGVGANMSALPDEGQDPYTTHNFYLDHLVMTGLIGTALFFGLIIYALSEAKRLRIRGSAAQGDIVLIFYYLTAALGLNYILNMERVTTAFMFWFLAGIIVTWARDLPPAESARRGSMEYQH